MIDKGKAIKMKSKISSDKIFFLGASLLARYTAKTRPETMQSAYHLTAKGPI